MLIVSVITLIFPLISSLTGAKAVGPSTSAKELHEGSYVDGSLDLSMTASNKIR